MQNIFFANFEHNFETVVIMFKIKHLQTCFISRVISRVF